MQHADLPDDRATNADTTPVPETPAPAGGWAERMVDRSPTVQQARTRSVQRSRMIVQAARHLIEDNGTSFTTQQLVKEAGVAMQTFYNHFTGKDQVLLALIEDLVAEYCAEYAHLARNLPDPVERLRFYVTSVLNLLAPDARDNSTTRFITTEHWRLHQLYPDELARATRPFTDLLLPEIRAAAAAGQLRPINPEYDAWLINQLVMAIYHHYAFAAPTEPTEQIAQRIWMFCLGALGGTTNAERLP